ncbi:hypothetical protein WR25_14012 isoform A [Diploscapter pachys]|uniref:Uncharacterized protein n=1 Tax=Diploscapter pachys TaxID=2018661 RepID=A0A2A2KVC8_9BILA|nr:hypothetical protein WR25_14012 isoform A [Diploscapter pachys]
MSKSSDYAEKNFISPNDETSETIPHFCYQMHSYGPEVNYVEIKNSIDIKQRLSMNCTEYRHLYQIEPHPENATIMLVENLNLGTGSLLQIFHYYMETVNGTVVDKVVFVDKLTSKDDAGSLEQVRKYKTSKGVGFRIQYSTKQPATKEEFRIVVSTHNLKKLLCETPLVTKMDTEDTQFLPLNIKYLQIGCPLRIQMRPSQFVSFYGYQTNSTLLFRETRDGKRIDWDQSIDVQQFGITAETNEVDILVISNDNEPQSAEDKIHIHIHPIDTKACICEPEVIEFDFPRIKISVTSPSFPTLYCPNMDCTRKLVISQNVPNITDDDEWVIMLMSSVVLTEKDKDFLEIFTGEGKDRFVYRK